MPLDLIEDTLTGNLYVAEFGGSCISLLKPKIPRTDMLVLSDSTSKYISVKREAKKHVTR
jgi:hypothetical protein